MTKNESKLLSLQWIAKTSAFCLLLSAFSVNAAMAVPASVGTVDEVMGVQQDKKVTGTVVDEAGIPVIGANVIQKGTTNGVITDLDGNFSFGDSQWGGNRDQLYRLCDTGDHGERTDGLASETDGGHAEDR